MFSRLKGICLTAAALFALSLKPAHAARVQFVGCAGGGQAGDEPAPRSGPTPNVHAAVATRLAYYRSVGFGILAPRGWYCFATSGSGGGTLIVSEQALDTRNMNRLFGLRGRVVIVSLSNGGTSGRFVVARAIFRLFPAFQGFAERVAAEEIMPRTELAVPLGRADWVTRRNATTIDYRTLARRRGLGSEGRLAANAEPIEGSVMLLPNADMSLLTLTTRLGPGRQADLSAIRANFLTAQGGTARR